MRKRIVLYCLFLANLIFVSANAQNTFRTTTGTVIGYLEYLPQGYNSNSDKYPVVIFLHGLGERGANSTDPATLEGTISTVAKHGPPKLVRLGTQFPFILISPQLKSNYGDWPSSYVKEVIDYCKTYLRIDERRIYLTGLSLGGGGTWVTAQDFAKQFAAIAPICGSRNSPTKAYLLAAENLPVWAFHGDADTTVPLSRSLNMVNAINACTPKPSPLAKMTIYPGIAHNSWDKAYSNDHTIQNPNVYEWMLSYTNSINGTNKIPTANAGADVTKSLPSNSVILSGSGSDVDGTISSYSWSKLSGPSTCTLTNVSTSTLTAANLVAGTYVFKLIVTDNSGDFNTDFVKVIINSSSNALPIVSAGTDKTLVLPTNTVTIAGSGSDPDGTISSYQWTEVSGRAVTLAGTTTPVLTASSLTAGAFVFRLTVKDNLGAAKSDDVTVMVNNAPDVNAGVDAKITLPTNTITLRGTATDSDGTIASYAWSKISGPSVTLANSTTATLTASALLAGTYVFRLTVMDNLGASKSDEVTVTVASSTNIAPVAGAGPDRLVPLPSDPITLFGTASDADGTIVRYSWVKVSGGACVFTSTTVSRPKVSGLVSGVYVFRITVTDDDGASSSDEIIVTANFAPVVNAGVDAKITLPTSSVILKGSATDSDGTIASYTWSKYSGPTGVTLTNKTTPTLTASALVAGTYVFKLAVKDNSGAQTSDYVTVVVGAAGTAARSASIEQEEVAEANVEAENLQSLFFEKDSNKLDNASAAIYNELGEKIYEGKWNADIYSQVLNKKGLYVYNLIQDGNRVRGKIYITEGY